MTPPPEEEARSVRPYAVTGGRVRSASSDMPIDGLTRIPVA